MNSAHRDTADPTEMFKVIKTGKHKQKSWKRMVNKATFVGEGFTRKPVKLERFIRPMGLRMKVANVTHPELKTTFQLPILGVKKNPQSPLYTSLGMSTSERLYVGAWLMYRCFDQGYNSRSQRLGTWFGHHLR
jgi:ribosomal protein S8E